MMSIIDKAKKHLASKYSKDDWYKLKDDELIDDLIKELEQYKQVVDHACNLCDQCLSEGRSTNFHYDDILDISQALNSGAEK